jgi:translation elongation factor EF-Tu-like GTPase
MTTPGRPGVVVAGPVVHGVCRVGDRLALIGAHANLEAACIGFELINWSRDRENWVSVRLGNVELADLKEVTDICLLPNQ